MNYARNKSRSMHRPEFPLITVALFEITVIQFRKPESDCKQNRNERKNEQAESKMKNNQGYTNGHVRHVKRMTHPAISPPGNKHRSVLRFATAMLSNAASRLDSQIDGNDKDVDKNQERDNLEISRRESQSHHGKNSEYNSTVAVKEWTRRTIVLFGKIDRFSPSLRRRILRSLLRSRTILLD